MVTPMPPWPPYPQRSDGQQVFAEEAEVWNAFLKDTGSPWFETVGNEVEAARDGAVDAANSAGENRALAEFAKSQADIYRNQAAISQQEAAASASTAESVAGPNYPDTAAGLAATTDRQSFAVDNGDGTVTVWLNSGGVAVEQRTLATTAALAADGGAELIGAGGGGTVQSHIQAAQAVENSIRLWDLAQMGVNPDTPLEDRSAVFQHALDTISANGGGTAVLSNVGQELGIAGDVFHRSLVSVDAGGQILNFIEGGYRIDGEKYDELVCDFKVSLLLKRSGSPGPALFIGGPDATGGRKPGVRGRVDARILSSTGVGLEIKNGFELDFINPTVIGCASDALKISLNEDGETSANAINFFGGEFAQCLGRGYDIIGNASHGSLGILFVGTHFQSNALANRIGARSYTVKHIGGYTENVGYADTAQWKIGEANAGAVNASFDGMILFDGAAGLDHCFELIRGGNISFRNIQHQGFGTELIKYSPTAAGLVTGGWDMIFGDKPTTTAAPNRNFKPFLDRDRCVYGGAQGTIGMLAPGAGKIVTLTVSGVKAGSVLSLWPVGNLGGLTMSSPIASADNTIVFHVSNQTALNINPGDPFFRVTAEDGAYWSSNV